MRAMRIILSLAMLSPVANVTADGTFTNVALLGQQAPGLPQGRVFSSYSHGPTITPDGRAVFSAHTTMTGGPALASVWQDGPDGLQLVMVNGQQAPGADPGVTLALSNSTVGTNALGDVAFVASYSNSTSAYLRYSGGELAAIAAMGMPAPGLENINFGIVSGANMYLNGLGHTAFVTPLQGASVTPESNEALWTGTSGDLSLVVREGATLPGLNSGESIGPLLSSPSPQINDGGRIAFIAPILPGTPGSNNQGLWVDEPSAGPRLVIRTGSSIGTHGIDFIDTLRINNHGEIAFGARDTPSGGGATMQGIFVEQSDGAFRKVAVPGDDASGAGPGLTIGAVNSFSLGFNDQGQAIFHSAISGPGVGSLNDQAVWLADPTGGLQLVMREGAPAPHPANEPDTFFGFPQNFQLNNNGSVVFITNLLETGQIQSTRQSIWLRSPAGELDRIIADGDALAVVVNGQIQTREVSSLRFIDTKTIPTPRYFNDSEQIAFLATFTGGGSGLFVWSPPSAGDLNQDGVVDAADHVAWRKRGSSGVGYDAWQANFGTILPVDSPFYVPVPEPRANLLLAMAALLVGLMPSLDAVRYFRAMQKRKQPVRMHPAA